MYVRVMGGNDAMNCSRDAMASGGRRGEEARRGMDCVGWGMELFERTPIAGSG